jgi:hypothetical protein
LHLTGKRWSLWKNRRVKKERECHVVKDAPPLLLATVGHLIAIRTPECLRGTPTPGTIGCGSPTKHLQATQAAAHPACSFSPTRCFSLSRTNYIAILDASVASTPVRSSYTHPAESTMKEE